MPRIIEQWLLFKYIEGQFTPLSKPFKTGEQAEGAFKTSSCVHPPPQY
jgi:hypothetical protein